MGINQKIKEILKDTKTIYLYCEKCKLSKIFTGTVHQVRTYKNNWEFVHSHIEDGGDFMNSRKFTFNQKDIKDVGVMAFFTAFGALALFLTDVILPNFDFGALQPAIVPFIPVITYAVHKFIKGK
jgi:hypothetical protein